MSGLFASLGFAAPMALVALAALPAIWLLLRVTPPAARRVVFPPLRLFADISGRRETPARTPWWLAALRLLLAACVIIAAAGPVWRPRPGDGDGVAGRGPLALVIDNGAAAAPDWPRRIALAQRLVAAAGEAGVGVAVAGTAGPPAPLALETAAAASRRLGALAPQGHLGGRDGWRAPLADFLRAHPDAGVAWIADALDVKGAPGAAAFGAALAAMAGGRLQVYGDHPAPGFAIAGVSNEPEGLDARVLRTGGAGPVRGVARARDARGLPLGEGAFAFGPGDETATARISLPVEVRNRAARLEIAGQSSAMAVALLDASHRRRRVGLVTGVSVDQAQPLLSPTWYVDRALASAAEIREPRMGASEAVNALIDERAAVIVLADVGALEPAVRERLARWVKAGGVLVRFAGPRLAAAGAETAAPVRDDDLLPVRLRGDGRSLGGALSWETPKTLAPFAADGPFAGLRAPGEITVRRQLLAEPDGDLAGRTWAALSDGTPVVTARRDGAGLLVLFHVTADPSWSSLPMSGLFVQMLQRIVAMAPDAAPVIDGRDVAAPQTRPAPAAAAPSPARLLAPRRTLDGFGQWREPPAEARGVPANYAGRASLAHPAGLYGPAAETLAVNVLTGADSIAPADLSALKPLPLQEAGARDLRGPLLLAALALFLVDCLVMLLSAGGVGWPQRRRRGAAAAAALLGLGLALAAPPPPAAAQGLLDAPRPQQVPDSWFAPDRLPTPRMTPRMTPPRAPAAPRQAAGGLSGRDLDAAAETRLAYVVTGDPQVDAISRAGLIGLGEALAARTAFEPAEPAAVDPAKDELAFYPVLYWPVVAGRPLPDAAAIRKLDSYMKGGGLVVFDTRDALSARPGVQTPEGAQLQRMLAALDLPPLEPVPADHVLGKAFYLLDSFPGRYAGGQTWVEALPGREGARQAPARGGDGVTPLVITANDWAAAWAVDDSGQPMLPLVTDGGHDEERQRELALRTGINVVIHALTGNYKADQVHLPALLRRLGQ